MDAEIHTAMNPITLTHKRCRYIYSTSAIVFVSSFVVWMLYQLTMLSDLGITAQIIIGTLFVIISFWAIWVASTLYRMVAWWADMYNRVAHASELLAQTRQDLKELKSIKHELSSR
jgi:high-affinity Fe2+/Pb2+ permease